MKRGSFEMFMDTLSEIILQSKVEFNYEEDVAEEEVEND